MKRNGLSNKKILVVSKRTDIFRGLANKIKVSWPKCRIDRATTAEEARRATMLYNYHLLIVDEPILKTLSRTGSSPMQNFALLVLTDDGKLPVQQKKSPAANICGHLSVNCSEDIIPLLPRLLKNGFTPGWQKPFKRYGGIFNLGTVEALEKLFK